MESIRLAREAMASRFEIVLHGKDARLLRAAGEEALDEIERVEDQISIYRSSSQIHHANARAHLHPIKLEPTLFELLKHCQVLSEKTESAFDITLAPLIRCWGFMGGGAFPTTEAVEDASRLIGISHMHLDSRAFTIRFDVEGMMLDLGAIGKGYALERAKDILEENGIESALLHGGTSTVITLGTPPDQEAWKVAITQPTDEGKTKTIGIAHLAGNALSVSAVWGKSFQKGDRQYGHIIDGRTGKPALGADQAAIVLPSATDADALSTAFLVGGKRGITWLDQHFPKHAYCLFKHEKKIIAKGIHLC